MRETRQSTPAETAIRTCYALARAYCDGQPAAARFAGPLPETPEFDAPVAAPLPAETRLSSMIDRASTATAGLVRAASAAAPFLEWRQSYTEEEVGADFLSQYGWCHLAGPDGPMKVSGVRMFLAYWGPGLDYQMHWHLPEEIYLPLAGAGHFHAEGAEARWAGPGEQVHHRSNQPHATVMGPEGFFALILWRGEELAVDLTIAARGGTA